MSENHPVWNGLVSAIPNLLFRLVLTNAFLAGAYALTHRGAVTPGAEPAWLPDVPFTIPSTCVLVVLALALLCGIATRAAALCAGLLVVFVLATHLASDHLFNTATHLFPWLICSTALLLLPTAGTISVDALWRKRESEGNPFGPSSATLLVRLFLGAIFTRQGWYTIFTTGALHFAERIYVQPLAAGPLPRPLLWLAGVLNPAIQLTTGLLMLVGLWTKSAAAIAGLFLITILFGHVLLDPLDRGPDLHDYGFENLLLALAVMILAARSDRFGVDGWRRRSPGTIVGLFAALLFLPSCATQPHAAAAASRPCRSEATVLLDSARAHAGENTLESAWLALDEFRNAVRLDPECEPALAESALLLADGPFINSGPGQHLSARDGYSWAAKLAERAIALDEADPVPHLVLGFRAFYLDYDWCRALAEFNLVIKRRPRLSPGRISRAFLLTVLGRSAEALADVQALEADPANEASAETTKGVIAYMRGHSAEAVEIFEKQTTRHPSRYIAYFWLGMALVQEGRANEGVTALERCAALTKRNPGALGSLAQAYAAAGRPAEARAILQELATRAGSEVIPIYQNATVHLALGEKALALEELEQAVHEERDNWPTWLALDPRLAALHSERRFQALVNELAFFPGRACRATATESSDTRGEMPR